MLIKELPLTQIEINCLQELLNSKNLADIAIMLGCSYTGAQQKMLIWEAQNWIKTFKTMGGKKRYTLNKDFFYKKKTKNEIQNEADEILNNNGGKEK